MYLLALISTVIILILTIGLSSIISLNYARKRSANLLSWSVGLWVFTVSVALEVVFALGFENAILIKSYLVLVAVLVELLALGSVILLHNRKYLNIYGLYIIITTVFVAFATGYSRIGDVITHGVVFGPLPIIVTVSSILVTFPAAVILVIISSLSYVKSKNPKLLSIIAGVIIVSIAGTLYIVQFPAFLYYAEFAGILLLWIGFVDFSVVGQIFAHKSRSTNTKRLD